MIVQCSWKVTDDRPISDAVVSSVETESMDLEDEIMVENCVMLEAPEMGDGLYPTVPACQLLISCEPPINISRISVLCEARVIEIYGHHGEYLKTVKTALLDEADDMIVFRGDAVLDRPLSLCSIKFLSLRSQTEMWLYGVKIYTTKAAQDPQNQTVPIAAVEQRLSEMGLVLSDKAEAFKQLVQSCQKSSMSSPDIGDIISRLMLTNLIKNKSPSPERSLQLSDILNVQEIIGRRDSQNNIKESSPTTTCTINQSSDKLLQTVSVSTSPVMFESTSTAVQTEEDYVSLENKLKNYISLQMEDMDKKMWDKISKRFEETEAKILCKLEEIESFVKPQGVSST